MTVPYVGVTIVNWNLAEDTLACLDSVFRMTFPSFEVTVVDNGSSDRSVERIRKRFPQVHQLRNESNEGFAFAANQGIERALARDCDYALILNNDTIVAPDLLQDLVAEGEKDPEIGVLSPRIFFFNEPERTWHLAARWHPWLPMPVDIWQADATLVEADFVSGCGMLLRRRMLDEIGAFDTRYFMYGEDIDLCARARQAGYRVVAVPRARMWHRVSASASKLSRDTRYWRKRNQIIVYRRYLPRRSLRWLLPLYVLVKAAADVRREVLQGQPDLVAPLLCGVRDGLRESVEPVL